MYIVLKKINYIFNNYFTNTNSITFKQKKYYNYLNKQVNYGFVFKHGDKETKEKHRKTQQKKTGRFCTNCVSFSLSYHVFKLLIDHIVWQFIHFSLLWTTGKPRKTDFVELLLAI